MTEAEIKIIVRFAVKEAITDTLTVLGYKDKPKEWITQNKAFKLYGRARVERGMNEGRIRFVKDNPETKFGRVRVNFNDCQKWFR